MPQLCACHLQTFLLASPEIQCGSWQGRSQSPVILPQHLCLCHIHHLLIPMHTLWPHCTSMHPPSSPLWCLSHTFLNPYCGSCVSLPWPTPLWSTMCLWCSFLNPHHTFPCTLGYQTCTVSFAHPSWPSPHPLAPYLPGSSNLPSCTPGNFLLVSSLTLWFW